MNTLGQKSKKIVLIGDGGVGKTSYVSRLRTGSFERKYIPTMGVEVHPLDYWETNNLNDIFNIWDFAGQEKYGGCKEGYWKCASGAIVMFDVTSKLSCKGLHYWIENLNNTVPDIPIVICGNKVDIKYSSKIKKTDIENLKYQYPEYPFFKISTKSCYNIEKPIQFLREKLSLPFYLSNL